MKKRILEVVPTLNNCGGIENYVMNYFRKINKEKFQVDFVYHKVTMTNFEKEILSLGGNIYKMPEFTISNFKEIFKKVDDLFRINKYDVVHCHMANAAFLYLKLAKKNNIKIRILHSHQSKAADKLSHAIRNYPLLWLGKKYANEFIACSKLAGDFLFKNKNYKIVHNAIEIDRFKFSSLYREEVRNQYNVDENDVLIGNIGRCSNQKNQKFLLEIIKSINIQNAKLIIVGDGELLSELEEHALKLGIIDRVIFTGSISDTSKIYSAMDIFVLPSLYEGLPVVGVEAQCNGLNLIVSNTITKELNFTKHVYYLSLKDSLEKWCSVIHNKLYRTDSNIQLDMYDINIQVKELEKIYSK